jgi:hypothetical protein
MYRIIWKAMEIKLHPENMNGKDGFSMSRSMKSLIHNPKK